ncbi:hypothetical protein D3C87_2020840 [compost metagenome]
MPPVIRAVLFCKRDMMNSFSLPFGELVQVRVIEAPPSMSDAVPVTNAASSEAR